MQPEIGTESFPNPGESLLELLDAGGTIPADIDPGVAVWWISGIVFGFVAIYSIFLLYHWLRYAFTSTAMWVGLAVYFGGLSFLFSIMVTAGVQISG